MIEDGIEELLPFFVAETRKDIEKLKSALGSGNFSKLKALAHRLKGEFGGYGFVTLSDEAKELESISEKNDRDLAISKIATIETLLNEIAEKNDL